jgi:hypothetical protein
MGFRDLVKILDREYSQYRRRSAADRNGIVRCATCGKIGEWKDFDLGHYVTRAVKATRWDDANTAPQCAKCNRYMGGLQHLMREYLVKAYGQAMVESVEARSRMQSGETKDTLLARIKEYRALNKELQ